MICFWARFESVSERGGRAETPSVVPSAVGGL